MTRQNSEPMYIGQTTLEAPQQDVGGDYVSMLGESFYKIRNFDGMAPFFMSIVSSSNHWMFISSTGGLSAGRTSAEQSLFPYYTDDKLTENYENTGAKAILWVTREGRTSLWEPLSQRYRGIYRIERNIYKNITGTALVVEEINHSLELCYRYAWRTSDQFGFVKTGWLLNLGKTPCTVDLLDGIQNILPANITSLTQNTFSPLLDAYKRSELDPGTGLAIYALNSTLTDLAEPSESLLGTTVVQLGLDAVGYLLCSRQLDAFRSGTDVTPETEVRGQRGAYFVRARLQLGPEAERSWHLIADVCQDSPAIVRLSKKLRGDKAALMDALERDIESNTFDLKEIVASADGMQLTNDPLVTAHHFANVMFNVMRGGIFTNQYKIHKDEFIEFIRTRNRSVFARHQTFFSDLPSELNIQDLLVRAEASGLQDLLRLSYSYLPLSFSRRHGDPSRPWNRFQIDIKKADGSLKLGYEGNWRDIFQNWEALAYSYPEYVESMICTFLNATTADGYNPYRITQEGIDWEVLEPNNPWANIGYWSDHQIIYLQKLMEISTKVHPGRLQSFLARPMFSTANVPYRIKPYTDLLKDPYNTIAFDWDLHQKVGARAKEQGADGKLVQTEKGHVLHTNLTEKLLTLLLAKLVNFVPEGGIWMNTQRPEWNDANNALVGKGLSMVTLCYLRRFIDFYRQLVEESSYRSIEISSELHGLFAKVSQIFIDTLPVLQGSFTDQQRRLMMDELGQAGSAYRWNYYSHGISGECIALSKNGLIEFLNLAQRYVEHSLSANKRSDKLYHSYNILHINKDAASVGHLYEMLEGQVAILSSGLLSAQESLELLESLRSSKLYRADQHSYILYPDRALPGFLERNTVSPEQIQDIELFQELIKAQDKTLIVQDDDGNCHFSGNIRNAKDVIRALHRLESQYASLVKADTEKVLALFEAVFRHNEFTGRSGTFFAYEGLGSIYWHMVSKLLLAVQETIFRTRNEASTGRLKEIYNDIRMGLSFNKTPDIYGAFPTDPYSHTPKGQGAKQPGMTGLVKEEILTRQAELGVIIEEGRLTFDPLLFDPKELLNKPGDISYTDTNAQQQKLDIEHGSLVYTICQTPIIIQTGEEEKITVQFSDGTTRSIAGNMLDEADTKHIFQRDGVVHHLTVQIRSM